VISLAKCIEMITELFACKYEDCEFTFRMIIAVESDARKLGYSSLLREHFTTHHGMSQGGTAGMICASCCSLLHASKTKHGKAQRWDLADQLKKHLVRNIVRKKQVASDDHAQRSLPSSSPVGTVCLVNSKNISPFATAASIRLNYAQKVNARSPMSPSSHATTGRTKRKRDTLQV
jgi:hypothetical protein